MSIKRALNIFQGEQGTLRVILEYDRLSALEGVLEMEQSSPMLYVVGDTQGNGGLVYAIVVNHGEEKTTVVFRGTVTWGGVRAVFDGFRDELDNYKDQDLKTLLTMIEEEIAEVEGMMSLAMTRALTEPEDASMESFLWAGAQDNGSIDASCLCETYAW